MNRTSARLAAIAESATLAVDAKAKALKAKGENVIGFGAGEPDFPTPENIVEAAVRAIKDGKTGYCPNAGVPELREALVELLPEGPVDVLACGPEPMLDALRGLVPTAQLAWEAPMACGYGACYGCVVERGGHLVRLCVEGPVLSGTIPTAPSGERAP